MRRRVRKGMKANMLIVIELDQVCRSCGFPDVIDPNVKEMQFLSWPHHIILRSQGGGDSINDMILPCNICDNGFHGKGNLTDEDGNRITGDQFMLSVLDRLEDEPDYRWHDVHEKLRQKVEAKLN